MSIRYFVAELGHWLSVLFVGLFFAGFLIRWMQTYRVGKGHFLVGMVAVFLTLLLLLAVAFAPEHSHPFFVLEAGGSAAWVLYNDWYFHHYPVPDSFYRDAPKDNQAVGKETRLGHFLTEPQPEIPVFKSPRLHRWALVLAISFVGLFGFYRVVTAIAWGDRRVVAATRQAGQQTASAVAGVKHEVAGVVALAVDTLARGQSGIAAVVRAQERRDSASRVEIKRELKSTNRSLAERLRGVSGAIERSRQSPIVPVGPIPTRPIPPSVLTPERVKPGAVPRFDKRGRRISETGEATERDSLLAHGRDY